MELFAVTDGVNPTTVIGLLSLVITAILAGVGWAGKRWLGPGGLQEKQTEATQSVALATANTNAALETVASSVTAVANCVRQHDERVNETAQRHAEACEEAGGRVKSMHSAALMACDEVEKILTEHGISCTERIQRIRLELQKES
jgi:hypothetical protein